MKINVSHLTKQFGSHRALDDVNIQISAGMFGLLGPNGAGKTTLMRILTTLIPKTSGEVCLNGIQIGEKGKIREMIGYLPQDFSMYPTLSVYEAMDYLALLSGIKPRSVRKQRITQLLEQVNLQSYFKVKVKALSGGMKRRLGIAQALIHNPKILIVDEPTAGLDPEERIRFRNLLSDLAQNRIVILSTHIVEDIEFSCENLAILQKGKVIFHGKTRELIEQAKGGVWSGLIPRGEMEKLRKEYPVISTVSEGEEIRVRLLSQDQPFSQAEQVQPSIEDAYIKLVKGV